ncbi:hypothetical protein [Rhodococcus artemisiae]|uniref:SUKH-4 immunity protein of toxin-antitoxin system n=1 Tax=Rhodococcus artemisiae TaxID=714159 RepID=A0ABU7L840_9NOCA|nr:hypothetical protein [Rhodococcus artemisiae]MEE2057502.1 hypothetical protein [Rhodococcus artemisiae]
MSDLGASEASFERLRQEPFFEVVVDLVAGYLATAFDDPESVAGEKWTLSCLPTTNEKAGMTRLFSLDVGPLEVLYVDRYTENGETVDYRTVMVTSISALVRQLGCPLDELLLRYPLLRFRPVEDASAGGDAVAIDWFLSDEGADDQFFMLPLDESTIGPLAALLADNAGGPSSRPHNRWFAQYVLDALEDDD